ncbi:Uncharacterised protein [uncultured archaeon]|nr:Uncharacterised protein [uncultured archaeon]
MDKKEKKSGENKSYTIYYLIGIIILILIIVLYFSFFRLDIKIKTDKILKCSDGTVYFSCSTTKPLYCLNGTLVNMPIKCGCNEGLIVAGNQCKDAADLVPNTNFSCNDLVPKTLFIRFSDSGYPIELMSLSNYLINNNTLKNFPGKYCLNHLPAKAGENINVGNLFYCYGSSDSSGGVNPNGIVEKSYKISYEFTLDKNNCTNLSSFSRKCSIDSISCSWNFTA